MTSERTDRPHQQPAGDPEADRPETLTISDPTVMRALAHPVRMGLIELFAVHETLTATQASEALGESPANCAFHLRTLAKYGFVEEAGGGRGRERPWRASRQTRHMRIRSTELDSEQAHVAAGALEQVLHDRWMARTRDAFATRGWGPQWEESAGSQETLTFMTPDELRAVRDEMTAVLNRHLDMRRIDPSKRPPGALPVTILSFAYPRLDLTAQLADDEADPDDPDQEAGQDPDDEPDSEPDSEPDDDAQG